MLIDIHTHVIPAENEKTFEGLLRANFKEEYDKFYRKRNRQREGHNISFTEHMLVKQLKSGEISKAVVMSADQPGMHLNEFVFELARAYSGLIIPSISVDPNSENATKRLDKYLKRYLDEFGEYKPIVKFYPHRWCSPEAVDLDYFRVIRDAGALLITHTGAHHSSAVKDNNNTNPVFWKKVLEEVKGLPILGSHCGTPSRVFKSYENIAIKMAEEYELFYIDFSGLQCILPSGNYYEISRPAFDLALASIRRGTGLEKKIAGGSDYFIVPDINRCRHEQQALLNHLFDPYENSERLIKKA